MPVAPYLQAINALLLVYTIPTIIINILNSTINILKLKILNFTSKLDQLF